MSKPVSVYDSLERQDCKILRKVSNAKGHPLLSLYFKNSFTNRLVFKYELAM